MSKLLSLQLLQVNLANPTDTISNAVLPAEQVNDVSLLELAFQNGIVIMSAIVILSIIVVYIFFDRYFAIMKAAKEQPNFMESIKDYILEGKVDAALSMCKVSDTPMARMIEKGIQRIGKPLNDITAAIENIGKLEIYKLEKNLATIATISSAAPMIGFLGTVIGMISTFHSIDVAGSVEIKALAGGIYTAMFTTVAGLIVGIVAFFAYNVLVARMEKVINKMETQSTEFLDLLNEPG